MDAEGCIVCSAAGRSVAFHPDRPLATVRQIERSPSIVRAGWELIDGKPVFVAWTADGGRRSVDTSDFTLHDQPASTAGHLDCAPTEAIAIDVSRVDGALVFTRTGAEPLSLVLRRDGAVASFEHERAVRLAVDDRGLRAHSSKWTARYLWNGSKLRLASVTTVDAAARDVHRWQLAGGLCASRSAMNGDCSLRLGDSEDAPTWPLSSLLGPRRIYLESERLLVEVAAGWSRRVGVNGLVDVRWPDARGAAIAAPDAHRQGKDIVAGGVRHSLSLSGPLVTRETGQPVTKPGEQLAENAAGWKISLPRYGSDCAIEYQGIPLDAEGGALPMDMAIVPGGLADAVLIDRLGLQRVDREPSSWSAHRQDLRSGMLRAVPTALIGASVGADVRPCFTVTSAGVTSTFALSSAPEVRLEPITASDAVGSWALGKHVVFRFDRGGTVRLSRVLPVARHDLPPLPRAEACVKGRLAFDTPVDLILARPSASTPAEVCMVMRANWEWPDLKDPGSFRGLVVTAPDAVEPEFGRVVRAEWFTGSDLEPAASTAVIDLAGAPILWYPFGERLFLFGERRTVWLELGQRWRGRRVD
jgi:hypothetical protein